jgi:hypothetical protein
MILFKTEEKMLTAIHDGLTDVSGGDVHTFKTLLGRQLVTGVDGLEDDYFDVALTPIGREVVAEIFKRD